jgi:creatinine amidohydrolase
MLLKKGVCPIVTYYSTAEEIRDSLSDTAILPVGSTEQHGPHLPIGTDYLIAGEIAAAVGKRIDALLLPALPISTCREHKGGAGSVWMNSSTFHLMIRDIAESLRIQGFRRLVLLIAHGGVFIAGPAVREINSDNEDIKLIRVDLATLLECGEIQEVLECHNDLHAGEVETSLMLYLDEKLVKMDRIENCIPQVPRDFLNYGSILKYCKNGVWGMPGLASREKGEKIFKLLVQKSTEYIRNVNQVLKDL